MTDERETAWLIEDVWMAAFFTHYIHRDFDAVQFSEQAARNKERRRFGSASDYSERFVTKDANEAMRFETHGRAIRWLAEQPRWINSGQFQAREHMWPGGVEA